MKNLPVNFAKLYWALIKAGSIEEMKTAATKLMRAVKDFAAQMRRRIHSKRDATEGDLRGTYEEIYSNWKNKMHLAAETEDSYLSLMTAASCQNFYDEMYSEYMIDRINLMENCPTDHLSLAAEAFDDAMEEYKRNYDQLGMQIRRYQDLDEFERRYLE